MKRRNKLAAAVFVGASLLLGGAAGAAESTGGSSILRRLCEASGGYYYPGKNMSYCFYRDGTIVICDDEGCMRYPPDKNAATLSASSGISKVARA